MKKILLALIVVIAMTSLASAQLLMPANTLGAGKMGWLGAISTDMNSQANSSQYGVGGYLGYGLTNDWDIYAQLGYGIGSNPPAGVTLSGISTSLLTKYQFIRESVKGSPVSVAAVVGYGATTATMGVGGFNFGLPSGDLGIGAVVSKVMVPWVPYGAAAYHSVTADTSGFPGGSKTTGSRIEMLVGTQMLLSKDSAIVGEFSYNSYSVGTSYTNNQVTLGYASKI